MEKKPAGKWHLYMILCSDGTYYTGITNDVSKRIERHNKGTASRYTRSRRPVTLVHTRRCKDRSDALKKEFAIKQLSREEKEGYLRKHGKGRRRQIPK
ncbi:MAG: GIY-YIG nuclease family protein [Nitrospirota bacterium]|nr:GIY-YIG nuclease family protein [Nitrospirota bacterium]